jgi:hypothetical protein
MVYNRQNKKIEVAVQIRDRARNFEIPANISGEKIGEYINSLLIYDKLSERHLNRLMPGQKLSSPPKPHETARLNVIGTLILRGHKNPGEILK